MWQKDACTYEITVWIFRATVSNAILRARGNGSIVRIEVDPNREQEEIVRAFLKDKGSLLFVSACRVVGDLAWLRLRIPVQGILHANLLQPIEVRAKIQKCPVLEYKQVGVDRVVAAVWAALDPDLAVVLPRPWVHSFGSCYSYGRDGRVQGGNGIVQIVRAVNIVYIWSL